jgi:DNA-binding PadR family transcriptional regulator
MSATRLLVLGVVRMYGQAHGYQVRRELLTWSADTWANVQPGSIYHALKKMAKEGLLTEAAVEEGESGPDRTVYRLAPDGETEFQVLLARALSEPERGLESLSAAITFITTLPRARAVDLLTVRIAKLEGQLANARLSMDAVNKPAHVHELPRLWEYTGDANIRWARALVDRLAAGGFTMADDSPDHFGRPAPVVTH